MKIRTISILLCFIFIISCFGCTTKKQADTSETITVIDHLGNEIIIPKEINKIAIGRIFPLPSVVAVFLNSAEKIVGIPEQSMTAAANSLLGELYPEILNADTNYINGSNLNIEALLELNPDVFLYNAADVQHGEICQKAGIPAIAVAVNKWEYDAIETLDNWMNLLTEIFPENSKNKQVEEYSENTLLRIKEITKDIPESEKINLFFLYQYTDTMIATSGNRFFGQWWADSIDAYNVGETIDKDNSVTVNMEQIYSWNPECILISNFTSAQPETLYNDPNWAEINAVKNKRVYKMPLGMYRSYTCGIDTPVTLLWIAKTVYPEYFTDINIIEETKKYYEEVFNVQLTDKQAEKIFAPSSNASAY